jgi:hypothetical protein
MCQQSAANRSTENRQVLHNAGALDPGYGAPHVDAIVTFLQQPRELMLMQLLRPCNSSCNSSPLLLPALKIGTEQSGALYIEIDFHNVLGTSLGCHTDRSNR